MDVSVQTPAGSIPVGSSSPGGLPGTPGINSGAESRLPGDSSAGNSGRDSSSGDLVNGTSGNSGGTYDVLGGPSGDYSLDTLPGSSQSGTQAGATGSQQGQPGSTGAATGTMTAAEQTGALDEALRRGYEEFDGFILGERSRAKAESNAAGSSPIGDQGQPSGSGGAVAAAQSQTLPGQTSGAPAGVIAASPQVASAPEPTQTFPPPEDIPRG
ncbi:MAG: hypothetical protein RL120_06810, partial [Gammaproteobacteria bacterium]